MQDCESESGSYESTIGGSFYSTFSNPTTPINKYQSFILTSLGKENFLTPIEVEIIFAKIISTVNEKGFELEDEMLTSPMRNPKLKNLFVEKYTKQGRLDFESFIFGLSIIAGRIYPHLASDQALLTLVEKVKLTNVGLICDSIF